MSVFKYVPLAGAVRYLQSWHLRVTPPAEFNDPFEMRPSAGSVFSSQNVAQQIEELRPDIPATFVDELRPMFGAFLGEQQLLCFSNALFGKLVPRKQLETVLQALKAHYGITRHQYELMRMKMRSELPARLAAAKAELDSRLPDLNLIVNSTLTEKLPARVGILCLSRNENQPLMWAHYADSHKGVLLEFDESHACFLRRVSDEDEFGFLRKVIYAEERPEINFDSLSGDAAFEVLALTKADPWQYEQEMRFLYPLERADKVVNSPENGAVHLIACPPGALKSVTLGCKSVGSDLAMLRTMIESTPDAQHVLLRQARLDARHFALVYNQAVE